MDAAKVEDDVVFALTVLVAEGGFVSEIVSASCAVVVLVCSSFSLFLTAVGDACVAVFRDGGKEWYGANVGRERCSASIGDGTTPAEVTVFDSLHRFSNLLPVIDSAIAPPARSLNVSVDKKRKAQWTKSEQQLRLVTRSKNAPEANLASIASTIASATDRRRFSK